MPIYASLFLQLFPWLSLWMESSQIPSSWLLAGTLNKLKPFKGTVSNAKYQISRNKCPFSLLTPSVFTFAGRGQITSSAVSRTDKWMQRCCAPGSQGWSPRGARASQAAIPPVSITVPEGIKTAFSSSYSLRLIWGSELLYVWGFLLLSLFWGYYNM